MSNDWNVQSFLNQLKEAQAKPRSNEPKGPSLEKTYLNYPDNLGRYQIFPMISTVTGMPFEYLYKTREVNLVTGTNQDGTKRTTWHKLLPLSAYNFIDSTGRLVSSLTMAERELLESAYGVFDRLMEVVPESNRKDICRYKNYAVGNAYVINKFGLKDQTKAVRSKYSTLLVCTSKDFANALDRDIKMQLINFGNDYSFLNQIYNRQLKNRTGWLIFNIQLAANGIGFSVSASHTANLNPAATEGLEISEEEAELMQDPIKNFLGWQAGEDKLFNPGLITKIIEEMNIIISKASSTSSLVDINKVAQATTSKSQSAYSGQVTTNDPMIASAQSFQSRPIQNQEQMNQNNDSPFSTPPAAQFDPVAQVPNNYNQFGNSPSQGNPGLPEDQLANPNSGPSYGYGYQQPSFAQQAQGDQGISNPFDKVDANPYSNNNTKF